MSLSLIVAARTHPGQIREHNEDSFLVGTDLSSGQWNRFGPEPFSLGPKGSLFMVADGMGGANAGEVASELAAREVQALFGALPGELGDSETRQAFSRDALLKAHDAIALEALENPRHWGMGTTAVLAWIMGEELTLAWVGDSRAYLLDPDKSLSMLSEDHSMVWDLVKKGKISPEEARVHPQSNVITQALGDAQYPPEPESRVVSLSAGCRLLLCSDGLNGMLPDSQIRAILAGEASASDTATQLVNAANEAGGEDNITVIVVDVFEEKEKKDPSAEAVAETPIPSPLPTEQQSLKTQPLSNQSSLPGDQEAEVAPLAAETLKQKAGKGLSPLSVAGIMGLVLAIFLIWWMLVG